MKLYVYSVYKPLMGMNCTELGGDLHELEGAKIRVKDLAGKVYEFHPMQSPSVGRYWSWQGGPIPRELTPVEDVTE